MSRDIDAHMEAFGLKTPEEREIAKGVLGLLEKVSPQDRQGVLDNMQKKYAISKDYTSSAMGAVRDRHDAVKAEASIISRKIDALTEIKAWVAANDLALSAPTGSSWHKLKAAWDAKDVYSANEHDLDATLFFKNEPHVIVIEHDWAAAFSGAGEFDAGEFRLPFPSCCFEFVMGGKRVLALMVEGYGANINMRPFIHTKNGFICGYHYRYNGSEWTCPDGVVSTVNEWLAVEICKQVRAASIALEADVVESEPVEPPAKLNIARTKRGELPINGYSVIRISSKRRQHQNGPTHTDPKWRVRCHFRRGHWRHYQNHKTWVKWMLVGNPDLGFVNKHYRL